MWTKAVIQYLRIKLFILTSEPSSHALKRALGGWFVVFLAMIFVTVTPFWFIGLGKLSTQVVINALGLQLG